MVAAGAVGTICFLPAESDGAVDETVGEDSAEEVERVNCEDSPAGSAEEGWRKMSIKRVRMEARTTVQALFNGGVDRFAFVA